MRVGDRVRMRENDFIGDTGVSAGQTGTVVATSGRVYLIQFTGLLTGHDGHASFDLGTEGWWVAECQMEHIPRTYLDASIE